MKNGSFIFFTGVLCVFISSTIIAQSTKTSNDEGWISLFNGKNLEGWKAGDNASTFSVEEGMIKVAGERSHIYYVGDVENHNFRIYFEVLFDFLRQKYSV